MNLEKKATYIARVFPHHEDKKLICQFRGYFEIIRGQSAAVSIIVGKRLEIFNWSPITLVLKSHKIRILLFFIILFLL